MKNILILLITISLFSCKRQFEGLTNFTLEYTTQATVQSNVGINLPFNVYTPPVETNAQAKFSTENTRTDLVEEIFIESLKIKILSPTSADFSFLESINIAISANGQGSQDIGWKNPVPSTAGNEITLDVTQEDLQRFIVQDEFGLDLTVTTDELLTQDHTFEIVSVYRVKAKLLN